MVEQLKRCLQRIETQVEVRKERRATAGGTPQRMEVTGGVNGWGLILVVLPRGTTRTTETKTTKPVCTWSFLEALSPMLGVKKQWAQVTAM